MPPIHFPHPETAQEDGLVAIGGNLKPETILLAYAQGIFPWPMVGPRQKLAMKPGQRGIPLTWFSPPQRAIIFLAELHLSRSLQKQLRQTRWTWTRNKAFKKVISACATVKRAGQKGTWIVPEMIEAYTLLHELGHAHSLEVWEGEELVGGLYGVQSKTYFSAESMFHIQPNASKCAVVWLCELQKKLGYSFIDIQMLTPHMEKLGAKEISRAEFLKLI